MNNREKRASEDRRDLPERIVDNEDGKVEKLSMDDESVMLCVCRT